MKDWKRYSVANLISDGVLFIGDGYRAKNEELANHGIPFARVSNINNGFHLGDADRFPEKDLHKVGNKISQHGDVVFTSKGTVGRFAFVREDVARFVYSPQLCFWRVLDTQIIDPRFLFSWMFGREFFLQINGVKGQTDMADYVSLVDQRNMHITLPPLSEQRAIAGILGALDDKIEVNRRMNVTLESMARAVFRQWFVESEEVGNWETVVLNDLAESILGGDWGKDTNEDGTLLPAFCIRGADIPDLQAGGTGKMPLRYIKPSSLEKRKLQAGDIVVEISGGSPTQSTGRPVFISDTLLNRLQHPLVASNFCRVFRPKDAIVSNFVYFWLRFLYSRDEFFQYENGTTGIKNFAFTIFCEQYYLSMPPKKMLEKYHQFTTIILEAMQRNAKESRTLGSLRDSLLPKLMRGEVRVK